MASWRHQQRTSGCSSDIGTLKLLVLKCLHYKNDASAWIAMGEVLKILRLHLRCVVDHMPTFFMHLPVQLGDRLACVAVCI